MVDDKRLGEDGLTSVKANHVCNVIKEIVKIVDRDNSLLTTLDKEIIVDGERVRSSTANFSYDKFMEKFEKTREFDAVSACFREDLKFKDAQLKATTSVKCPPERLEHFTKEAPPLPHPVEEVAFDWGMRQLSFKQQKAYDRLVAMSARIGKQIHNDGVLVRLRREPTEQGVQFEMSPDRKAYPVVVACDMQQQAEVDKTYYHLQRLHVQVSQQLNALKAQVNELVTRENLQRRRGNEAVLKSYRQAVAAWNKEEHELEIRNAEVTEKWRREKVAERQRIAKLKIVVPDAIQPIITEVEAYIAELVK